MCVLSRTRGHARTTHGCAPKCTHVAQREDNGLRCGLSNGEANEVNGRPSPSPYTGWAKASPFRSSGAHLPPPTHPPTHRAICVPSQMHAWRCPVRRSCSSPSLLLPVPPPKLRFFRYVLAADTRWGATVFLSLSPSTLDSNTAQVRHPLSPAAHISSSTVSSSLPFLSRCRTPRAPSSLHAYFIALLALHFHPRVLRLPLPAALSRSRVNELTC